MKTSNHNTSMIPVPTLGTSPGRIRGSTLIVASALLIAAAASAQFDLSWRTIDGGGAESTGGGFALAGTIGQPDAGAMSGGDFELSGGFWPGASGSGDECVRDPEWLCDGDVDGDGVVNPVDHGLVQANFCTASSCTDAQLCQYDMDCDGQINPVDSGIVQGLFGTCDPPPPVCP